MLHFLNDIIYHKLYCRCYVLSLILKIDIVAETCCLVRPTMVVSEGTHEFFLLVLPKNNIKPVNTAFAFVSFISELRMI